MLSIIATTLSKPSAAFTNAWNGSDLIAYFPASASESASRRISFDDLVSLSRFSTACSAFVLASESLTCKTRIPVGLDDWVARDGKRRSSASHKISQMPGNRHQVYVLSPSLQSLLSLSSWASAHPIVLSPRFDLRLSLMDTGVDGVEQTLEQWYR